MRRVLILLSTYNGEKYLEKQLNSLYQQTNVDIHLLVRDDGSSDKTIEILNNYSDLYGKITILQGENVGPALSFYYLLEEAWENYNDFDYYAFSDQDDEWDRNKICKAVEILDKNENPIKLYFCKFRVINGDSEIIEDCSSTEQYPNYKNCLFRNPAPGCSQVFSKGLLERSVDIFDYIRSDGFNKQYLHYHDVWTIQLACYLNGLIYVDDRPLFSYRQHSSNVTIYSEKSYVKRFKSVSRGLKKVPNKYSHAANLILNLEKNNIDEEKLLFLDKISHYRDNYIRTLIFGCSYSMIFDQMYVKIYAFYAIIKRLF